jgi:hypothetical protein
MCVRVYVQHVFVSSCVQPVQWIRIDFHADSDPNIAFVDPDPDPDPVTKPMQIHAHSYPDSGKTLKAQKVVFI